MNILENYPVFENNQVLTSDQLNNLVTYLDQQNRLTRARLVGIGAICGFNLEYIPKSGSQDDTLLISKGIGITSEGFLIAQSDCYTTRYRKYILPETVRYTPFEDPATNEQDVDLFELLSTDADPGNDSAIKTFNDELLKEKVVLLFLEIFDKDIKTCLAKSCDEVGQTRVFTLRRLLISVTDINKVLLRLNDGKYDPTFPSKFNLPVISLPREAIKSGEPEATVKLELLRKYSNALQPIMDDLNAAIQQTYTLYEPILEDIYTEVGDEFNTVVNEKFNGWNSYLTDETGTNPFYGMQYFYDFIKDLILAYEEFKYAAFGLCSECVIDLERFPQHLMLGLAIPEMDYNIDSTLYRNRFIHSMAYSKQKGLTEKVRLLHVRMASMITSFNLEYINKPDNALTNIYIIPSVEKLTKLSQRSIPFYYDPYSSDWPLINHWNYDIEKRKLSEGILTYHNQAEDDVPSKSPLKYDLDRYPFLRIESVLGKEGFALSNKINELKADFNLPFNVVSLKIDPSTTSLTLDPALWDDLRISYSNAQGRLLCDLQNLYANFSGLSLNILKLEYSNIELAKIETLVEVVKDYLPENFDDFKFPVFFDSYCTLLELLHRYKLALTYRQGRLIHVLINVVYPNELHGELTTIEESLDIIKDLLDSCIYRELYMIYYRLAGRKKYLLDNHPEIFSNFIKNNPGIEHAGGVNKGGTFIVVYEDNNTDESGKNRVFADFSLPYLCCCECIDMPTVEQELENVNLPDLALPDSSIGILNSDVNIDVLHNDYTPLQGPIDITTNSQYANYNQDKNIITYNRNSYLGLDSFYYTLNRHSEQDELIRNQSGLIKKIISDDLKANDLFGYSVDIVKDRAIVGALGGGKESLTSGCAYVFELKDGGWNQQAKLIPAESKGNEQFGYSVAIYGNYAAVGAIGESTGGNKAGSVYLFAFEKGEWIQKQKIQPDDIRAGDYFGCSIALDSARLIIGAFGSDKSSDIKNSGCVYFYLNESDNWVQRQKIAADELVSGDYFGYSVALNRNNLVIGAYCKDKNGPNSGCAYVYTYNEKRDLFFPTQEIFPSDNQADDYFGSSVSIYGNYIVVGAMRKDANGINSGCAYVFVLKKNTWVEAQTLVPLDAESGDYVGYSVDIYKDAIIIGSRFGDKGGENIGCAYLFGYANNKWIQIATIQPPELRAGDLFGSAVAIYNDVILISAPKDDSKALDAGSVYVFPKQIEFANNSALVQVLMHKKYALHIQAKDDLQIVQQHDELGLVIDVLQNDTYYDTTELELPETTSNLGGKISMDETGKKIKFLPGASGKDSFKYQLKDDERKEISKATVTVFVTKFDLTVPDIVYQVTDTNENIIPITYALQNDLEIKVSEMDEKIGTLTVVGTLIIFKPGNDFITQNSSSFSYVFPDKEGELVKGIVHLINSIKKNDDCSEFLSNVMAGTIMAFAFNPNAEFTYDVILQSVGSAVASVVKILRVITGLGLKEANALVGSIPAVVKKGVFNIDEAETIKKQLENAGAIVEIIEKRLVPNWLEKNGWLECNGQMVSGKDYSRLFERIGNNYGRGNGEENSFNVPDLRGEFLRGWDSGKGVDIDRKLGTLQSNQLLTHTHNDPGHNHSSAQHSHKDLGHIHENKAHSHENKAHSHSVWTLEDYRRPITGGTTAQDIVLPRISHETVQTGSSEISINAQSIAIDEGHARIEGSNVVINSAYTGLKEPKYIESTDAFPHGSENRPRNVSVMYCIKY